MLLPLNIDFYRPPIVSTQPTPQRHSPSIPSTSAVSVAAQEAARPKASQKTSIYGSVTTADIAENIRAVLVEDNVGARVVLTSEDITFVEEGEEKDRVKHLGVFEIDIRIKGAADNIRRTIKVNAQD
jgi:ribosomal protein L9